eukprot:CAMPEP_0117040510 /NCGR_PEP_ID=MMETSP0472-20121206/28347_1 /TAXON_ID=693140 ORGANISM="Tiarina fusus, Strain LIS" /NCGR_SAMPLE_ID=MMETSP0472 /ASSEMBLY_ACC=CAM_ASM_000603 /LENGTH=58 /DNA_ID=CAMNT_0004751265 /DNA_START=150 /DNA_END=322 /DNA_ORIENTATION=-
MRQWIVELLRDGADLWKPGTGNAGEVVVLVMVPDVEADGVERTVIGIRLLALGEDVML